MLVSWRHSELTGHMAGLDDGWFLGFAPAVTVGVLRHHLLIRAPCGVMDMSLPLWERRVTQGKVNHCPLETFTWHPISGERGECLDLRTGHRINMLRRKKSSNRCALIPSQDINRSVQMHDGLKQSKGECCVCRVTGFTENTKPERPHFKSVADSWMVQLEWIWCCSD